MKYILIYGLVVLCLFLKVEKGVAQKFEKVGPLPSELNETSGLEVLPNGWLISHNDSGDEPWIYILSETGQLIRKIYIQGISFVDWEDVSYDEKNDVLYVGDIGNNSNNRQDMEIGKVVDFLKDLQDTMQAESNAIGYDNQMEFPPNSNERHFDVEAMAYYKDYLYLFSKNRTSPYDGKLYMWKYPTDFTSEVASLVDSIEIGGLMTFNWITGADIFNQNLALTSSMEAWVISFKDTLSLQGSRQKINYSSISQKESIAWLSEDTLFISDESIGAGASLYRLVLENGSMENPLSDFQLVWSAGKFQCQSQMPIDQIRVFSMEGKLVLEHNSKKKEVILDTTEIREGVYVVEIRLNGSIVRIKKMLYER